MSGSVRLDSNLVFKSDRLDFKPLSSHDVDISIELWTDPCVTKYASERAFTEAEVIAEMPTVVRRCCGGCIGIWCLRLRETGEKVGSAALLPMPVEMDDTDWQLVAGEDVPAAEIEIGYFLKKSVWGNGYATEACTRLVRFAFEETPLLEIVAVIDPENMASKNVLLKSGFSPSGTIRAYATDLPGFKISRSEWLQRRAG